MRILVLGDTHCKADLLWRARDLYAKRECDYLVFLGDACDNWDATQSDNVRMIDDLIETKAIFGDKFIWLIGNHDWGYYSDTYMTGHINEHASEVQRRLVEHKDEWQVVARIGKYLFSHAGLSDQFARAYGGNDVINNINALKNLVLDNPLNNIGPGSGGYSTVPSPLWARPDEIRKWWRDNEGVVQVVGHTPTKKIWHWGHHYLCDTFSQYPTKEFIGDRTMLLIEDYAVRSISLDTNHRHGIIGEEL